MAEAEPPLVNDPTLVLRSIDVLASNRSTVAAHFYGRLFGRHPHLAGYFQSYDTAWRERMFLTALRSMMMTANSPQSLDQELGDLVERHRQHQIQPEHFELFSDILLETLAYYGGSAWTPDVAAAWATIAARTAAALSASDPAEDAPAA